MGIVCGETVYKLWRECGESVGRVWEECGESVCRVLIEWCGEIGGECG